MRDRLSGIFPPIPTSFSASGDVDGPALAENVTRWMATRLSGILALGSNGEAALLDERESDQVVAAVRAAMPGDRLLLVGTGRESTRATIDACRRAAALGAVAMQPAAIALLARGFDVDLEMHVAADGFGVQGEDAFDDEKIARLDALPFRGAAVLVPTRRI